MKVCTKCGEAKSLDDFPKNGKTRDGRQAYRSACRDCEKWRDALKRDTTPSKERATKMESKEKQCPYCEKELKPGEEVKRYFRGRAESMVYHISCNEKYEEVIDSLGGEA